jgi:DnaJ-domain-containing protein 1
MWRHALPLAVARIVARALPEELRERPMPRSFPPKPLPALDSEAIARVVALAMFADASVHPAELAALEAHGLLAELGLTRDQFLAVASDCFTDAMVDMRARSRNHLLDDALVDRELARVDDPQARVLAYRAAVALLPADGRLHDGELALLQRMVEAWQLPRATVDGVLERRRSPATAGAAR